MRRKVMVLLLIVLALFSLTGLAAEKKLTVISGWSGQEMDAFMPVLQFEKETGIRVIIRYTALRISRSCFHHLTRRLLRQT